MGANVVFSHVSGGRAFLRVNATATLNVVANSSAGSDLSTANGTVDPVIGATITKLIWSTGNTTAGIIVKRGANTIATLFGASTWDFKSIGVAETEYPTATIVITMPDANSTLFLECSKLYAGGTTL